MSLKSCIEAPSHVISAPDRGTGIAPCVPGHPRGICTDRGEADVRGGKPLRESWHEQHQASADHHHHDDHGHDEFESFVLTRPEITDATTFATQVADVIRAHDILRLKGFAAITGKPMRLTLQAVGPRVDTYFDRPFAAGEPRETKLVVIGQAGMDRAAIEAALSV